ncbi:MAG: hypothetical protein IT494_07440 [Gammaproteobacteria bacterium]|nr:hypothetical protein [Gammaproteobacteria bacterium]
MSLEERVFQLLLAAEQLRKGELPEPQVRQLLAGAVEDFLLRKTPLDKALGLRTRRGSHRTAWAVAALIGDEEDEKAEADSVRS